MKQTKSHLAVLGLILISTLLISGCGTGLQLGELNSGKTAAPPCTTCRIFVSAAVSSGGFGSPAAADALCNADAGKPATGTYKALIADNIPTRRACSTAACGGGVSENLNWVLYANTPYTRVDGTPIGTTTAAGIFGFPYTNAISGAGAIVWTGLSTDWTTHANTCLNWTSSANGDLGRAGSSANPGNFSLSFTSNPCDTNTNQLICVEQ